MRSRMLQTRFGPVPTRSHLAAASCYLVCLVRADHSRPAGNIIAGSEHLHTLVGWLARDLFPYFDTRYETGNLPSSLACTRLISRVAKQFC